MRLDSPEHLPVNPIQFERALAAEAGVTHVGLIHCETSAGIVNPVEDLGVLARRFGVPTIVVAMSSFGAIEINLNQANAAFLVSSANKCLEGVPGFSFVLARRTELLVSEGIPRSVTLDLLAQWRGLEKDGQFRFTPPTHALLAFDQALREFDEVRAARRATGQIARRSAGA